MPVEYKVKICTLHKMPYVFKESSHAGCFFYNPRQCCDFSGERIIEPVTPVFIMLLQLQLVSTCPVPGILLGTCNTTYELGALGILILYMRKLRLRAIKSLAHFPIFVLTLYFQLSAYGKVHSRAKYIHIGCKAVAFHVQESQNFKPRRDLQRVDNPSLTFIDDKTKAQEIMICPRLHSLPA